MALNDVFGFPKEAVAQTWLQEYIEKGLAMGLAEGEARGEARGRAEGEARGRAEGEARGEARGRADTLLRFLRKRFGDVPKVLEDRIWAADNPLLEEWTDRVLEAKDLKDIFGSDHQH